MKWVFAAEIVTALVLIILLLLQARGGGLGGGIFGGQAMPTYRTRRGVERTIFRLTIVLAVIFVLIAALSAKFVS